MTVYHLKHATPRMKYQWMRERMDFDRNLRDHQSETHAAPTCPDCGQPLGSRPMFMVGVSDLCFPCYEAVAAEKRKAVQWAAEVGGPDEQDMDRFHTLIIQLVS